MFKATILLLHIKQANRQVCLPKIKISSALLSTVCVVLVQKDWGDGSVQTRSSRGLCPLRKKTHLVWPRYRLRGGNIVLFFFSRGASFYVLFANWWKSTGGCLLQTQSRWPAELSNHVAIRETGSLQRRFGCWRKAGACTQFRPASADNNCNQRGGDLNHAVNFMTLFARQTSF